MTQLQVERLGHATHVASSYESAKESYQRIFGGHFFREWTFPEHGTANALITLSDTCIELFGITDPSSLLGRWAGREGLGGWHSIEWTVPSMPEAEETLAERSIRITDRLEGAYTYTHPRDCHGLCLELTEGHFDDDPREDPTNGPQPEHWLGEHPLGISGIHCLRVSAHDALRSAEWMADFVGLDVAYDLRDDGLGARLVGVELPDHTIEFASPLGDGPLADALEARGERILGVVYSVRDIAAAEEHLRSVGAASVPGPRADGRCLEISADATCGARFELVADGAGRA
jgi:hypothetical protein